MAVVGAGVGARLGGFVSVVEYAGALGAERLVYSEEVKVIVLNREVNNVLWSNVECEFAMGCDVREV